MANAYRNADLSLAIYRPLRTGYRFTVKIGHLFLVLHKCNIWIYFLLLLTQVDFFGTTFYFLESRKFSHYFYFLKSRIFGMYFYFLESSKVIYFWQHWKSLTLNDLKWPLHCVISLNLVNMRWNNHVDQWRNLCTSLLYFVMRVWCRHTESSRSLSHLLMSFLPNLCM